MTKDEVIAELSAYTGRFPREAVETATAIWSEIAGDMVTALEYAAANPVELANDPDAMLHTYAMYLCAEKRETRALAPILRAMSCPDPWALDALFGDTLTDAAGRIVASLFTGDVQPIQELIENREADEFSRGQGIVALTALVVNKRLEREVFIAYLRELFETRLEREPSQVWTAVVDAAAELAAGELEPAVTKAYEEGLLTGVFDSPESPLCKLTTDVDAAMDALNWKPRYTLIEDTVIPRGGGGEAQQQKRVSAGPRVLSRFACDLIRRRRRNSIARLRHSPTNTKGLQVASTAGTSYT